MIPQDIITVVERRIKQDFEDRSETFGKEISNIWEKLSSRGLLSSGMTVTQTEEAVGNEFRVRASLAWQALARGLNSKNISLTDSLAVEAKRYVANVVNTHSSDLLRHLHKVANFIPGATSIKSISELRNAAVDRINTEIDYTTLGQSQSSDPNPIIINYGIYQTGQSSSATYSISLPKEDLHEIEKAINATREAIEQAVNLKSEERDQALELIADVEHEIKRDKPNSLKIRGALQGLAITVQTISAAPQAYQLLKGAAALLGLQLP